MDFMSIFLSLAILCSPFAYFSVHFYEFMPSDVVLPADFSVQERYQFVELSWIVQQTFFNPLWWIEERIQERHVVWFLAETKSWIWINFWQSFKIVDSFQHVISVWNRFFSYACDQKHIQNKAWTRTRFAFEIDKTLNQIL